MFKRGVLKRDDGSYSAFSCQNCLFLAWKGVQGKKVQFSIVGFYFVTYERSSRNSAYYGKFLQSRVHTCIDVFVKTLYTFSLNPFLYHLIVLNVWSVTSTSSSHFFTAREDLSWCRETAAFYLLNIPVLTQQNVWKLGSENESSGALNLVDESVEAVCQGSREETQVSQICLCLCNGKNSWNMSGDLKGE